MIYTLTRDGCDEQKEGIYDGLVDVPGVLIEPPPRRAGLGQLAELLLERQVHLSIGGVLLRLLVQQPRVGHRLREGAQRRERGGRAAVLAADERCGRHRNQRARADAPKGGRVAHVGRQRLLEDAHDLLKLGGEHGSRREANGGGGQFA